MWRNPSEVGLFIFHRLTCYPPITRSITGTTHEWDTWEGASSSDETNEETLKLRFWPGIFLFYVCFLNDPYEYFPGLLIVFQLNPPQPQVFITRVVFNPPNGLIEADIEQGFLSWC